MGEKLKELDRDFDKELKDCIGKLQNIVIDLIVDKFIKEEPEDKDVFFYKVKCTCGELNEVGAFVDFKRKRVYMGEHRPPSQDFMRKIEEIQKIKEGI